MKVIDMWRQYGEEEELALKVDATSNIKGLILGKDRDGWYKLTLILEVEEKNIKVFYRACGDISIVVLLNAFEIIDANCDKVSPKDWEN